MLKKIIIGICISCLSNMMYEAVNNCYATEGADRANETVNQEDQQAQEIAELLGKYFAYTEEQISANGMTDACSGQAQPNALNSCLRKSGRDRIVGFIVDGPNITQVDNCVIRTVDKESERRLDAFEKDFIRVFTLGSGLCSIHALGLQRTQGTPVLDRNRTPDSLEAIYCCTRLMNIYDCYNLEANFNYEKFQRGLPIFKKLLDEIAKKVEEGKELPKELTDSMIDIKEKRQNLEVMLDSFGSIYISLNENNDLYDTIHGFLRYNIAISQGDKVRIINTVRRLSQLREASQNGLECWATVVGEIFDIITRYVDNQADRDYCELVCSGINQLSMNTCDVINEDKMLTHVVLTWPNIRAILPAYNDFPRMTHKKLGLFWRDDDVGELSSLSPYDWNMFPRGADLHDSASERPPVDLSDPTADYIVYEGNHFSRAIPRKLFEKVKEKLRTMGIAVCVINNKGEILE